MKFLHCLLQQLFASLCLIPVSNAPDGQWQNQRTRHEQDSINGSSPSAFQSFINGRYGRRVLLLGNDAMKLDIVGIRFKFEIKATLDLALRNNDALCHSDENVPDVFRSRGVSQY